MRGTGISYNGPVGTTDAAATVRRCARGALVATALLLSACSRPADPAAVPPAEPLRFVLLADPQFGFASKDKGWAEESANLRWALGEIRGLKPAFVAILGDFVQTPLHDAEAKAFRDEIAALGPGIPVHLLPGNHEVGRRPTPESLAWYRKRFGPDRGSFESGGCRFLFLDTSLLEDPSGAPDEAAAQAKWLAESLRTARDDIAACRIRRLFLLQHHPWFWTQPDDRAIGEILSTELRKEWLPPLEAAKAAVFAGHSHAFRTGRTEAGLEMFTTGSLSRAFHPDVQGFLVADLDDAGLRVRQIELPEPLKKPPVR